MTPSSRCVLATLLVASLCPLSAVAQSYANQGYLVDSSNAVVLSATPGLCWHTSEWTPAMAVAGCDLVLAKFAAIAPPALMAVAPPAVAVAPAPAGVPVAAGVPIAAPRHKISFSADAMFAFDKSDLKPEGKTMLEGLVQQIKSASYENIVLTGHADRIGSEAYNQKLSERRADAVKQFLADSGIVVGRIDTSGHGEKEPQTATGTCPAGQSAKAIACLQPDRRVDVEMQGTAP